MTRADVVVVGAGVMGAATARALARAGRDVVVLERFEIGHAHGSSHGSARIWRHSYRDPRYVRMMDEALPLWVELESECGEQLLSVTGALNFGADLSDLAAAMGEGSAAMERLSPSEVSERFPRVGVKGETIFDPAAGVIAAERAWRALTASAVKHGATLRENIAVRSVAPNGDGARVETDDGTYDARVVVVTAGAWAQDLLELAVRPTRETISYHDIGDLTGVPVLIGWSEPLLYGLPTPDRTYKVGEHIAGPAADPGAGEPDPASVERARAWLGEQVRGGGLRVVGAETCMYTNTADEGFILERRGPVIVGSPCSGHGFKFAPLVGARLAALV